MAFKFSSQEKIDGPALEKGLRAVIADGIMSHLMGVLTGGVFLVAIALQLGASNSQIGLIAAIPPLAQIVQLPAVLLIEKVRSRKTVAVLAAFISRTAFLMIALSPLLFPPNVGLMILVAAVLFSAVFGSVGGCAWNSWMRDLIPEDRMGTFFSGRMRIATILGIGASFIASLFIDLWRGAFPGQEILAYSGLFLAGFIIGITGLAFLARTPEPAMAPRQDIKLLGLFAAPFRDANFRQLMLFLGSWSFAVNLAAPFFTVYMLNRLGMAMSMIVALSIVSQVFNFLFLNIWGKLADRFSNRSVLAVSGPLFILSILGWTFTTMPDKHMLTLPILVALHIMMGISVAGVTIASGNIGLKLAPKGQATAYLATNALVNSCAAGLAPVLGGRFVDLFEARNLSLVLRWSSPSRELVFQTLNFQHWDFFFGLAFLTGLYALHRLSFVEEHGKVDDEAVRAEFRNVITRPLRSLSSGAGIFQLISFPVGFMEKSIKHVGRAIRKGRA